MSNNSVLVRKIIVNSYNGILCSHERELGLAMENVHNKFEKKQLVIHCVWHDSVCIFE